MWRTGSAWESSCRCNNYIRFSTLLPLTYPSSYSIVVVGETRGRGGNGRGPWAASRGFATGRGMMRARAPFSGGLARPPLRPQTVGCTTSITGTFPSRLKVHIGSGSLAGQDLLDCVAVFPRPKSKIQKNGRQPDPGSSVGSWRGRRLKVLLLVFCCCRAGLPCSRAVLL